MSADRRFSPVLLNTANSSLATAQAPLQADVSNVIQQEATHALRATPDHFIGRCPLSYVEAKPCRGLLVAIQDSVGLAFFV